jgi:hypothetical protein
MPFDILSDISFLMGLIIAQVVEKSAIDDRGAPKIIWRFACKSCVDALSCRRRGDLYSFFSAYDVELLQCNLSIWQGRAVCLCQRETFPVGGIVETHE